MKRARLFAAMAVLWTCGAVACDDSDDTLGGIVDAGFGSGGSGGRDGGGGGTGGGTVDGGAGSGGGTAGSGGGTSDGATADGGRADGGTTADGGATPDGGLPGASIGTGDAGVTTLTPGHVVAVLEVANQGEVGLAILALSRAQNAAVKNYANQMITEHSQASVNLGAVAMANGITPQPNSIAQQLQAEAQAMSMMLMGLQAVAFDRAYVQANVDAHTRVLQLLDASLIPSATGTPLAPTLTTLRATIQMHREEAIALLATLPASP